MTSIDQNKFLLPAWGFSLLLHGLAVVLAVIFAAQVKPILQEDIFKWDVALVEPVQTDSVPEPATQPAPAQMQPMVAPVQPPRVATRRPVEPPPDPVMHRVAPQQTVQMMHPEVTPPKPVEQREEPVPPPKTETLTEPARALQEKTAEPIEQQMVETPKSQVEPVTTSKEPEPVHTAEPIMAQRQPVEAPASQTVEPPATEAPAKSLAPEAVASSSPVEPAPAVSEAPVQTAKAPAKMDHSWLSESLGRRVAELKRYPSSARLNGQEGKVILKAVIRSDGHLADVSIQQSSGHQVLDAAAIETIRLACPLHMKHATNKSEIVVRVPIVYTLTN